MENGFSNPISVNSKEHLSIGGCDCVELAKQFGTPLYVMDENTIRNTCRVYKSAMDKYYNGKGLVLYASKAFCSTAMCRIADQEGMGLDVVSGGELFTALKAGFPMDRVYFHGNNKTIAEIDYALSNNVKRIVADNIEELHNINQIASQKGITAEISVRIKPGIDAHTHDFVRTGQIDSKFGVAIENGEAIEFVRECKSMNNIRLVGLHCHIGSQIFDLEPFILAASVMMNFISQIKKETGIEIEELNLGGGYGIKYVPGDDPIEYDHYIESVSEAVKKICIEKDLNLPFILMEPGRSITGPAGITLYTVGAVKEIKNVKKYVSIDGGMSDNPRYALYQSEYDAFIANRALDKKVEKVTIAGKLCESGDIIAKDLMMPVIKTGDILAVMATGAYNYSMSNNYNRIPRPAVILIKDKNPRVIVKREDYEDLTRNDIMPEDL